MTTTPSTRGMYETLGVRPIIHAGGTRTAFGGSRMRPEVLEAMAEASRSFVDMLELNRAVGRYIAEITGAEAGMVTGGSASGVVLSIAACMTGTDVSKVRRLPDASGMKDEVIMQKAQRGSYSEMYRFAGAHFVEVGTVNDCAPGELEGAITPQTAAVACVFSRTLPQVGLTLPEVCELAHAHGLPVIVDAAPTLPPKANLRRYITEGADLVVLSGGKMIRGPQSSGLLFGREDLVEAALANSSPNQAIGRPQKVSREDMVGLYVALKLFMESDDAQLEAECRERLAPVVEALSGLNGLRVSIEHDPVLYPVPMAMIRLLPEWEGRPCEQVAASLLEGEPRVLVIHERNYRRLLVNVVNLQDGEAEIVARRLHEEMTRG